MDVFAIVIIILVFSIMFLKLFKTDIIFSMVIFWMFAYSIFTMIGYLYYPERLSLVSGNQYYGREAFKGFYLYILGFFIFVGFFYFFINKIEPLVRVKIINIKVENTRFIFYSVQILYLLLLSFFLFKNYNQLSYTNQAILKNNNIWMYGYSMSAIFLLALINDLIINKKGKSKIFNIFLLVITGFIVLLTSLKAGQRIEIFTIMNALFVYFIIYFRKGLGRNVIMGFKKISPLKRVVFAFVLLLFIFLFQIIRGTRGHISELKNLELSQILFNLFNFGDLVFQDWLNPSLTLISSMHYKMIIPLEVIKSNLFNLFIIGGYPTLGSSFSRVIDPYGVKGYGYYYLTEGYQFAGYFGFIIGSFLIVCVYKFYKDLFISANNSNYNCYISGVITIFIINIVRGQSLFFIKGIYFFIIPAIILYFFQNGKIPVLYKPLKKRKKLN